MQTDTIIIGAGPIGLELAVAFRDASCRYLQLDAQQLGHTISWFPRQARFFSSPERIAICGVPLRTVDQSKATREEYLAYLAGVVQQFDLAIRVYERVERIEPLPADASASQSQSPRFCVHTQRADGKHQYTCRNIVAAIGDMHHPRRLVLADRNDVPGSQLPHVHPYFDEPHPYLNCQLMIVGGRNSAVEAAIRCYRCGAKVSLSYRRKQIDPSVKYWLRPEIEWLIKTGEITFFPNTLPVNISATHVTLAATSDEGALAVDGAQQVIPADFVLPLIGYQMDPTLLAAAGVRLVGENRRPSYDTDTMETNVPGLYVAGTAAAGSQTQYRLFIENGHSHVVRIARAITGKDPIHVNPLAYRRLHESPLAQET